MAMTIYQREWRVRTDYIPNSIGDVFLWGYWAEYRRLCCYYHPFSLLTDTVDVEIRVHTQRLAYSK